jgi:hypothetical protein
MDGTVLRATPDGTVTILAGETRSDVAYRDGTGDVARFQGPLGIAGDGSGTLYVADTESATLRKVECPFPTGRWSRPLPSGMTGVAEFRPDGTWTYTRDGESLSTGAYSTDAGTLTFLTDSGCSEQNAERGTYAWTYANGQLTFRRLDDQCLVGRVTTFDWSTWTRAE